MSTESPALVFELDEETGALKATFTPAPALVASSEPVAADGPIVIDEAVVAEGKETSGPYIEPPSMASIKEAMADQGYGAFWVDEEALSGFIRATQQAKEPTTMTIAQRRDGEFSLVVSDDVMTATLTLIPPQGGEGKGPAVLEAMREQGIVHGILHNELNAALAAGVCDKLVIAQGEWPVEGSPCYFTSLLEDNEEEDDEEEEEGEEGEEELDDRFSIIKFRDLGFILLVNPGDHLMRRTPPVPGTPGIDIKGNPVPARPMHEIRFNEKILGAEPDPEDPNLLVATISGQPVLINNGVTVNPVVEVENVDFSTGNIEFNGTITIKGDVKAGMVLKVTGDVIVKGLVEAAEIHAGGNVAVSGGILGHAATQASTLSTATTQPFATARVICDGTVQALFVESAYVQAGGAIMIKGNVRQSEMYSGTQIAVGKGGGAKIGQIVGGKTHATNLIQACWAGTSNGTKTDLQVGSDPFLATQLAASEASYKRKLEEIDQVIKLLAFLKANPAKAAGGMGEKAEATRRRLLAESKALFEEQTALKEKLVSIDMARIKITKGIYEGVEVRIGKNLWAVPNDLGAGTIQIKNGSVALG